MVLTICSGDVGLVAWADKEVWSDWRCLGWGLDLVATGLSCLQVRLVTLMTLVLHLRFFLVAQTLRYACRWRHLIQILINLLLRLHFPNTIQLLWNCCTLGCLGRSICYSMRSQALLVTTTIVVVRIFEFKLQSVDLLVAWSILILWLLLLLLLLLLICLYSICQLLEQGSRMMRLLIKRALSCRYDGLVLGDRILEGYRSICCCFIF